MGFFCGSIPKASPAAACAARRRAKFFLRHPKMKQFQFGSAS
ncbi:hypothetical protein HMPREF3198_00689 [Winkia neuii]|nr:hypothetical protein HMPREF3198_00689 [Winkia neuii]